LAAISLDTIPNTDLLFEFEMSIRTDSLPLKGWVVLDVADSSGNRILYKLSNWNILLAPLSNMMVGWPMPLSTLAVL
jgi:hypothetical protein